MQCSTVQCSAVRCSAVFSGSPDLLLEEVDIGPHVLDYCQQEVKGALLPLRASVYNKILRDTTYIRTLRLLDRIGLVADSVKTRAHPRLKIGHILPSYDLVEGSRHVGYRYWRGNV